MDLSPGSFEGGFFSHNFFLNYILLFLRSSQVNSSVLNTLNTSHHGRVGVGSGVGKDKMMLMEVLGKGSCLQTEQTHKCVKQQGS